MALRWAATLKCPSNWHKRLTCLLAITDHLLTKSISNAKILRAALQGLLPTTTQMLTLPMYDGNISHEERHKGRHSTLDVCLQLVPGTESVSTYRKNYKSVVPSSHMHGQPASSASSYMPCPGRLLPQLSQLTESVTAWPRWQQLQALAMPYNADILKVHPYTAGRT